MKVFHCSHCGQTVFFENSQCVQCGHPLAFLPEIGEMSSLETEGNGLWKSPHPANPKQAYRQCSQSVNGNQCNWAVPHEDPHDQCVACRLTTVIPNLSINGHREAWIKMEAAKRRLLAGLLALRLPIVSKAADSTNGLAFEFLADPEDPNADPVLTGHYQGLITIHIAEADDAERERRRHAMGEPYRTLLGHFRHEVGHYYWDRLIQQDPERLDAFRTLFGDERQDYQQSLDAHYANSPMDAPTAANQGYISAYAAAHPWEDWAETFAHYLHLADVLETAHACGLNLYSFHPAEPHFQADQRFSPSDPHRTFHTMTAEWQALSYLHNNLNRSMGLPDGYPFILSPGVIEKLKFIDKIVRSTPLFGPAFA